ncbi:MULTISPECIES: helix-turn-helix domain-containing protein [unclassified Lebetimonas]|uniref:helix-turn-helix domain-containing protein n=1 Tax=unclassified Lebetimonas TaxID=2648158 RepID=UPI000466DFAF|nr:MULTISPECIES: helix-turn-helix transcriptional regulator [unclassified Lebetimonas]
MTLGEKIKFLRENKGLNLSELAKRAGIAKSTLFKIEENKTNPTIKTIWAIAEILGVPFGELVGEGEIKEEGVSVTLIEKNDSFESYKMNLKENATYIAKPHFAGTKEKIFVLNGSITVGKVDDPKEINQGDVVEFDADCTHLYSAKSASTLIITIYYSKSRYFSEDVFVDVFDRDVYEELNNLVNSGVEVIRVIAKHDKYDGENVIKNENGIFIYKKRNLNFFEVKNINFEKIEGIYHFLPSFYTQKEMDRSIILHFTAFREELIFERYLALIGEINLAKSLALKSSFKELVECIDRKIYLTHLNNFLDKVRKKNIEVEITKLFSTYTDGGIYGIKLKK